MSYYIRIIYNRKPYLKGQTFQNNIYYNLSKLNCNSNNTITPKYTTIYFYFVNKYFNNNFAIHHLN